MAEYIPASIEIGGALAESKLDGLHQAADNDGVRFDWSEERIADIQDIRRNVEVGCSLVFTDPEARWGEMVHLEKFCRENGLSFKRTTDAKYEYSGEIVWWTPERGNGSVFATQDGEPVIPLRALKEITDTKISRANKMARVNKVIKGVTPPAIPPFVIS